MQQRRLLYGGIEFPLAGRTGAANWLAGAEALGVGEGLLFGKFARGLLQEEKSQRRSAA